MIYLFSFCDFTQEFGMMFTHEFGISSLFTFLKKIIFFSCHFWLYSADFLLTGRQALDCLLGSTLCGAVRASHKIICCWFLGFNNSFKIYIHLWRSF
jgi:hypothetical protein